MPSYCKEWSLTADKSFQGLCGLELTATTEAKTKQCLVCVTPGYRKIGKCGLCGNDALEEYPAAYRILDFVVTGTVPPPRELAWLPGGDRLTADGGPATITVTDVITQPPSLGPAVLIGKSDPLTDTCTWGYSSTTVDGWLRQEIMGWPPNPAATVCGYTNYGFLEKRFTYNVEGAIFSNGNVTLALACLPDLPEWVWKNMPELGNNPLIGTQISAGSEAPVINGIAGCQIGYAGYSAAIGRNCWGWYLHQEISSGKWNLVLTSKGYTTVQIDKAVIDRGGFGTPRKWTIHSAAGMETAGAGFAGSYVARGFGTARYEEVGSYQCSTPSVNNQMAIRTFRLVQLVGDFNGYSFPGTVQIQRAFP